MSKYIGTPVVNLSVDTVDVTGDITATDSTPELILLNDTHEDTDGGREGKVTFKGEQSGGEVTVLAQIQSGHDGTSDDEKGDLIFKTNDGSDGASPTERLRIDSDGKILRGHTASVNSDGVQADLQNHSTSIGAISTHRYSASASAPQIIMGKSRSGTLGGDTVLQAGDYCGILGFHGNDGSGFHEAGQIAVIVQSGVGNDDIPADMVFQTNAGGTGTTERMRITSDGEITTPANPVFRVYAPTSQTASGNNEQVTWTEELDRGGNFASNQFTTPVTGVYSFNVQFLSPNQTASTDLYIKAGSDSLAYARSVLTSSACHKTTHLSWIGTVTAGTVVSVHISTAGESIYGDASGDWTHFQGHLIG